MNLADAFRPPFVSPPFGSPVPLGASKMSIEDMAQISKPFIKVDKNSLMTAIQVLTTTSEALDVTGESGQAMIQRTEENLGISLSKTQRDKILSQFPSEGLKAVISNEQRGSIRFSRNSMVHCIRFLQAIL